MIAREHARPPRQTLAREPTRDTRRRGAAEESRGHAGRRRRKSISETGVEGNVDAHSGAQERAKHRGCVSDRQPRGRDAARFVAAAPPPLRLHSHAPRELDGRAGNMKRGREESRAGGGGDDLCVAPTRSKRGRGDGHSDVCFICRDGGLLMECEGLHSGGRTCSRSAHVHCAGLKVRAPPRGAWRQMQTRACRLCSDCSRACAFVCADMRVCILVPMALLSVSRTAICCCCCFDCCDRRRWRRRVVNGSAALPPCCVARLQRARDGCTVRQHAPP